jgi:predicted ATPase
MGSGRELIGRQAPRAELARAFADTAIGRGGLVLLAGEAGVGKTRLAIDSLSHSGLLVLGATASPTTSAAFGPIVGVLRAFLRLAPDGLSQDNRLARYLPVLLPELGTPPADVDRTTLFEVVLDAFVAIARCRPTALLLEDLHTADHATLDLLQYVAASLRELPLLVLGTYRTDELRRDHALRRLRAELRRSGGLRELLIEPLGSADTAALAGQILAGRTAPALAAVLHERTEGLPLFVEELVAALQATGRLEPDSSGVWHLLDPAAVLPVPESVRDLVLLRAARLSEAAQAALDVAAVAGVSFDLDLVGQVAGGEGSFDEALAQGLLVETGCGAASFRHALLRDAFYSHIAWPRRRTLHRRLAEVLEHRNAAPKLLAGHWLAAREPERARRALLMAADDARTLHAYSDAASLAQRALELWPAGELEPERMVALDHLGQCAQLSGDLSAATTAWREVADAHHTAGDVRQHAEVQRLELLAVAADEARQADRIDLQARILGLEGDVRARMGNYEVGVKQVRGALALALEHNLSGPAAEVYQRLADALEHAGDYPAARQNYLDAAEFCQAQGAEMAAQLCRACMTVVLRQTGDWDQCAQVCAEVLASAGASAHARSVALGMLGLVRAQRGDAARARPLLLEAAQQARQDRVGGHGATQRLGPGSPGRVGWQR